MGDPPAVNRLYFGDCLEVMREDIPDESVDLIYLDPPYNSKRLYNAYIGGAQWVAFNDTWQWYEAIDDFHEVAGDVTLGDTMEGLRRILGEGPNLAYLSYMANRLRECRRVLKPTGSIYLHCDQTMSHYLKVVMDVVFGETNFRNEITWQRTSSHNDGAQGRRQYGRVCDIILFYTKGVEWTWNRQYTPYDQSYIDSFYRHVEAGTGRRYRLDKLTAPGGAEKGNPEYEVMGVRRYWAYSRERMQRLIDGGRVIQTAPGRVPSYKRYLDEMPGKPLQDLWTGIGPIGSRAKERLGYPTQKPLELLDRILRVSSNVEDVVLDPFCGCGTTIHAAHLLGRHWIGIDVCVNACKVIEKRLREHFSDLWADVEYIGMPKTATDAHELADIDKFRFERWAASLVDGMEANKRQRSDKGIDGRGRLPIRKGVFVDVVSQVKGGSTGPSDVQAFNGARQQAGADLGIFTCFEDRVTANMRNAAVSAGRFMDVPRVQIYTVEDYFSDRRPVMPAAAA